MPHYLENKVTQLLHGLEEALHLHQQTVNQLVESGYWTSEQGATHLQNYQNQLHATCSLVAASPTSLQLDRQARQELKAEFQRLTWRLELHEEVQTTNKETDAIVAYLNHKREQAMQQLKSAIKIARSLWQSRGNLRVAGDTYIQIEAINQFNRKPERLRLKCWYWGQRPVHYDTGLVDEIQRQTQCQATIFQRMPEGFIRIATNIRNLDQRRAVGTFIPADSKVAKTILAGETFQGSAFVLNNWYLSIYEPLLIDGEIQGILYVGRQEALELTPSHAFSAGQVDKIFSQLRQTGAFEIGLDTALTEKLIQVLSNLPDQSARPLLQMGLKEVAALLMQEQEKQKKPSALPSEESILDRIVQHIHDNLSEDISVDLLAELSCMSKASFYRYFKTKYNTTPNVFITQERLRQAHRLMESAPSRSVRSICQEVGFKNASYFIKLFREHYGLTPKQWQLQRKIVLPT